MQLVIYDDLKFKIHIKPSFYTIGFNTCEKLVEDIAFIILIFMYLLYMLYYTKRNNSMQN